MKALVYEGPGKKALKELPRPVLLDPGDAIVRMVKTTICGTDLHILKGDVPSCTPGRILGHEGVGQVEEVGSGVKLVSPGDYVLISCISACGICQACRRGMFSHCQSGGWVLGNTIDGTQAEFVRTPHADTSLYRIPKDKLVDALILLSDILPTGFECGVLRGQIKIGDNVAIVGAGPIGLATLLTARLCSPAQIFMLDPDSSRLERAKAFGATAIASPSKESIADIIDKTDGLGADVVVEAVGTPEAFELCQRLVAPGGVIANIGVHGRKADLHLERLWSHNITITTRLVDTVSTPLLLKEVNAGRLKVDKLITHRFAFDGIMDAYETFAHAADSHALKVLIDFDR